MSEPDADGRVAAEGTNSTIGHRLVSAFRAARIAQRPALRADLKGVRASLQAERLERLASSGPRRAVPKPAAAQALPSAATVDAAADPVAPAPAAPPGHSMFAHFIIEADAAPRGPAPEIGRDAPPPQTAQPEPEAPSAQTPLAHPANPAVPSPPVAVLGFGPGMTTRFHQLGIATVADLAGADAAGLREALGDVSRLINIDAWICTAQAAHGACKPETWSGNGANGAACP